MGLGLQEEMGSDLMGGDTVLFEDSQTRNRGELSALQRREQKEDERIVKRFRVISAAEVQALLENREFPRAAAEVAPVQEQGSNEKSVASGKKRDREEAFGSAAQQKTEDLNVDELLGSLKKRVLEGETLNQFKKEIN